MFQKARAILLPIGCVVRPAAPFAGELDKVAILSNSDLPPVLIATAGVFKYEASRKRGDRATSFEPGNKIVS
jgi:hypothetical protein